MRDFLLNLVTSENLVKTVARYLVRTFTRTTKELPDDAHSTVDHSDSAS